MQGPGQDCGVHRTEVRHCWLKQSSAESGTCMRHSLELSCSHATSGKRIIYMGMREQMLLGHRDPSEWQGSPRLAGPSAQGLLPRACCADATCAALRVCIFPCLPEP